MRKNIERLAKEEIVKLITLTERPKIYFLPKILKPQQVAGLLTYGFSTPPHTKAIHQAIEKGQEIHKEHGFSGTGLYERNLKLKIGSRTKETHRLGLRGRPDKINWKKSVILELKTFTAHSTRKRAIKMAKVQLQLYCWLVGLRRGRVVLYDLLNDEMEKTEISIEYNPQVFKKIIISAIQMYSLSKKTEQKGKEIRNKFNSSMKKLEYF